MDLSYGWREKTKGLYKMRRRRERTQQRQFSRVGVTTMASQTRPLVATTSLSWLYSNCCNKPPKSTQTAATVFLTGPQCHKEILSGLPGPNLQPNNFVWPHSATEVPPPIHFSKAKWRLTGSGRAQGARCSPVISGADVSSKSLVAQPESVTTANQGQRPKARLCQLGHGWP